MYGDGQQLRLVSSQHCCVQEKTNLATLEVIVSANLAAYLQEGWEKLTEHSIFLLVG